MKNIWKSKTFWLTAAALLLVGGMGLSETMAYFTTYVEAQGGYPVELGHETEIKEDVGDLTKHISISNVGSVDCYVRVKVFSGSLLDIEYLGTQDGSGNAYWTKQSDGYWYYKDIVPVGGKTEVLQAKITVPEGFENEVTSFNVIVIQECTPVLHKADGTPYADWSLTLDTRTDIGQAN